jgi:hypothetical protein
MLRYTRVVDGAGVVRRWWDDATRMFHEYDAAGVEVGEPRTYTPGENVAADVDAAEAAARAAYEAQRVIVRAIITDLQAEKDRAQVVIDKPNNQITGADTKDVARAAKRIADAAIDLARFVQDNG